MSDKPLRPFFKLGTILAITPTNPPSENLFRKVYASLIWGLLTLGAIFSLSHRHFYKDFFFMKKLFYYEHDIILLAFSYYVIVVLTFWRRTQWTLFVENLEKSKKLTNNEDSGKIPYYIYFVLGHLVFFIVSGFNVIIWYKEIGFDMVKQYGVRRIEEYLIFFYLMFLNAILNTLLKRYQSFNAFLSQDRYFSEDFLQTSEYVFYFLKQTVDIFNELFGWPVFFIIMQTIIQVLLYLHSIIITTTESYDVIGAQICTIAVPTFLTICFLLMCNRVVQEAGKTVDITYGMRWQRQWERKQELYEFSTLTWRNLPKFTAAGFFVVGKATIIDILSIVNSSLVILLQFESKK